jgi:hypothetical protein
MFRYKDSFDENMNFPHLYPSKETNITTKSTNIQTIPPRPQKNLKQHLMKWGCANVFYSEES